MNHSKCSTIKKQKGGHCALIVPIWRVEDVIALFTDWFMVNLKLQKKDKMGNSPPFNTFWRK
jgi:hypothetical protein